jgi:hypothetical protein
MEALMLSMVAWLNLHTEYDTRINLPNVVLVQNDQLCRSYGITDGGVCKATRLKGFYDKDLTIYLDIDFDPNNRKHQAHLLHELVHYVQWHNGEGGDCWGMLEVEAYQLQDEWLYQQYIDKPTDPFKMVMLEAACDDDY